MNVFKYGIISGRYATNIKRICRRNFQSLPEFENLLEPFKSTFPDIKNHLLEKVKDDYVKKRYNGMLSHLQRTDHQIGPTIALKVHEAMTSTPGSQVESEGLQHIHIIAWISETLHAAMILADDKTNEFMKREEVPGYVAREKWAATDSVMITLTPYFLLCDWFEKDVFFQSAVKILQKNAFDINAVKMVDFSITESFRQKTLTWEKYRYYCALKWSCFDFPFKLSAFEATKSNLQFDENINQILEDLGYSFLLGKDSMIIGTKPAGLLNINDVNEDIKEGKITFGVLFIMNCATEEEKDIIMQIITKRNDQQFVKEVFALYEKYDVANELTEYWEHLQESINKRIELVSNEQRLQDGLKAAADCLKWYHKIDFGKQ